MRRTRDIVGKTFRRMDVTIRIVEVTVTAVQYVIHNGKNVYCTPFEVFELWFEGSTEVTETKGGG